MLSMAGLLKELLSKETSQKAIAEIRKEGGLKFFVKQEKAWLLKEKELKKDNPEELEKQKKEDDDPVLQTY